MPKVRAKSKGFGQWCREDAESFQESIGEYCIEERQAAKSDVEEDETGRIHQYIHRINIKIQSRQNEADHKENT